MDKLNPTDVREYMTTYLDNYKEAVGDLMGKRGLRYVISDSWEAGTANCTDEVIAEFTKRRVTHNGGRAVFLCPPARGAIRPI